MTPASTLQSIQDRLAHDTVPAIIDQSMPRTLTDAFTWARSLPFWEEYKGQFTDQAIAIARVVSRRAMKEFDLSLDECGRVVKNKRRQPAYSSSPTLVFSMRIGNEVVKVQYTEDCFPGKDSFYFVSEELDPPPDPNSVHQVWSHKPHPLSETGFYSHSAPHDAVIAVGGPQQYAELYVAAKLEGKEQDLEMVFEGESPKIKPRRKKKVEQQPVLGEHTADVVEERSEQPLIEEPQEKLQQGMLF